MPKFKKDAVLEALNKKIKEEQTAFQKKADQAPELKAKYEVERQEWLKKVELWRAEAIEKFAQLVEKFNAEEAERNWGSLHYQFGHFVPPYPPSRPNEVDGALAAASHTCSMTERAIARISLMQEDKNGGISLSDNDEIFYRGLIPCR